MKFKTERLKAELDVLAPAIADKSKIVGLDTMWFDGKCVSAYNDVIGIEKPLETDFIGGVPGKVFLNYLEHADSDEITLTAKGVGKEDPITEKEYQDLYVVAGASEFTLALRPIEGRLWTFPVYDKSNEIPLTKESLSLLDFCLVSVPKTAVNIEHLGVTFETSELDQLSLYTTDRASLSWAVLPRPAGYNCERLTASGDFCQQVLKICADGDKLYLSPTAAVVTNKAGTRLFGRILEVEVREKFQEKLNTLVGDEDEYIGIPAELTRALDRAAILAYGKNDSVQLSAANNVLRIYLKSEIGEINESIPIEGGLNLEPIHFDPGMIKRALSERTYICIKSSCMTMVGPDNFVHLIAPRYT